MNSKRSRKAWALLIVDGVLSGTYSAVRFRSTLIFIIYPNITESMKYLSLIIALVLAIIIFSRCKRDVDYYIYKGKVFSDQGDYVKAIKEYDKALEIDFKNFQAYLLRGVSKSFLGDSTGATDDIYHASILNSEGTLKTFTIVGLDSYKSGDYKYALFCFNVAVILDSIILRKSSFKQEYPMFSDLSTSDKYTGWRANVYWWRTSTKLSLNDTVGAKADLLIAMKLDSLQKYK